MKWKPEEKNVSRLYGRSRVVPSSHLVPPAVSVAKTRFLSAVFVWLAGVGEDDTIRDVPEKLAQT